jgi:hypothetical protein
MFFRLLRRRLCVELICCAHDANKNAQKHQISLSRTPPWSAATCRRFDKTQDTKITHAAFTRSKYQSGDKSPHSKEAS